MRLPLILPSLFGIVLMSVAAASQPANRPNFVLCMTDDHGWGDVGYNGHPVLKTPNLDAMAAAGVRFDHFYAAHPVCSPTRASVLTGRTPNRYRCYGWGFDLPLREETVAELLKTRGYTTGHFGKWHVGGLPNADGISGRGVPESFDPAPRDPGHQGFDEWFSAGNWFDLDPPAGTLLHNGEPVGALKGDTSDIVMDAALQFIRAQVAAGQPFLCVVWFPSPHSPWRALPEDKAPYLGQPNPDFLGEVAAVDRAMGHLRAELGQLGVRDNTLVWFNSDNGAAGGSSGPFTGGKGSLWEGGTRVPGLLEWPARVRQPFRTNVPASTVDILPTLCDIVGIKPPVESLPLDGISLLPIIEGRASSRPSPLGFEQRRVTDGTLLNSALVDGNWKLLRVREVLRRKRGTGPDTGPSLPAGEYLFDVDRDVAEQHNLAAAHPEVLARMRAQLDAFTRSVEKSASIYPLAPEPVRLRPRLLMRKPDTIQPLVDRLAFPFPGWSPVGEGTRQYSDGALHLDGPAGRRPGIHHSIALRNNYLQFAAKVSEGGRVAVELGPLGQPAGRLSFGSSGLEAIPLTTGGAAARETQRPLILPTGTWHNVLLEFSDDILCVQIDGHTFSEIPVTSWPKQRYEGFALIRDSGAVEVKDVWLTAGEVPGPGAGEKRSGTKFDND